MAKAEEDGKDDEVQPHFTGWRFAFLWRLLTCQMRARRPGDKKRLARYSQLVLRGRKLSEKKQAFYSKMCWWSNSKTRVGGKIFVIAPRGPKGELDTYIDMWELFAYAVAKMHDAVVA